MQAVTTICFILQELRSNLSSQLLKIWATTICRSCAASCRRKALADASKRHQVADHCLCERASVWMSLVK